MNAGVEIIRERKGGKRLIWDELNDHLNNSESNEFKTRLNRNRRHSPNRNPQVIERKVYLELMVLVDEKMEEYYGEYLENHVLTLLFMVFKINFK